MTDLALIQESKRSAAWMTFFYITAIPAAFAAYLLWLMEGEDGIMFGFFVSFSSAMFLAGCVNLLNWRDVLALMFEDEEPLDLPTGQPRRARRTITINSAHGDHARLEVEGETSNIIYLGEYGLLRSQWYALTVALRDNPVEKWRWSRDILISTGIFTGLTVDNRYNDVTKSFEKARAVKVNRDGAGKIMNAHVTGRGIEALHAAAGMQVVTS